MVLSDIDSEKEEGMNLDSKHNMENVLRKLINEARSLLSNANACYTKMDIKALQDMICMAEKAINGAEQCFTRNREYYQPREQEAMHFAYDRFTMVPTYFEEGKLYGHYGLKEAVQWFSRQNYKEWDIERLKQKKDEVLAQAEELMARIYYGNSIGQYDWQLGMQLERRMEELREADMVFVPRRLVRCIDAMHEFKFSCRLRSEGEQKAYLVLSEEKLQELRVAIQQHGQIKEQYERIKEQADGASLAECRLVYEQIWEKHSYEELNQHFFIWGNTGQTMNMQTPQGTRMARLSFHLSSEDNETDGLGHIWIANIKLGSANGSDVLIPNDSFSCQKEIRDGKMCLFLCNKSAQEESNVICEELISLQENSGYTLFFEAKQDGKFKKGLQTTIEFLSAEGAILDTYKEVYNRKSFLPMYHRALRMQCNAIVYAMTGDMEYAQKAKYEMLTFMNNFCQGAEYWLVQNARPEGNDSYGGVQAGRIMCSIASAYSFIDSANTFDEAEKKQFYGMVDYLLRYCLDKRDRIVMSMERVQQGSNNWQTDMCIGVAALMMVLPDYPDRKVWLYNAEGLLKAQLAINLNQDGSWPESIRYHQAALEHFATFSAMWKLETGEDWLVTTRLKDMFAYILHTITPPYEYFDYKIGTPPFGDHKLSGGDELQVYGLYIKAIEELDKQLADEMYQVWSRAGYPAKGLSDEALAIENLLYAESGKKQTDNPLMLKSAIHYQDSGIYIFRHTTQSQKENYLAVMAAKKRIGHGHLDQGSFILYYQNVPIVMDSGIEGYFDTSTQWHLCSYSHACLQFAASDELRLAKREISHSINLNAGTYSIDHGWLDVPHSCQVVDVAAGREIEHITLKIAHPLGEDKGGHYRTILFENESGIVHIKDRVENYRGKILFSLPLMMQEAVIEEQCVHAKGYYSVDADVEFITPVHKLFLDKGRTTRMFPTEDSIPMLLYVRAEIECEQEVEVIIRPIS